VGAALFSLPFLWMLSTSLKVDRELYTRGFALVPEIPAAPVKSPYMDDAYFADSGLSREVEEPTLRGLIALMQERGVRPPAGVDRNAAEEVGARGVAARLRNLVPDTVWAGTASAILSEAARLLEREDYEEIQTAAYRRFEVGAVRVRHKSLREVTVQPDIAPHLAWQPKGAPLVNLISQSGAVRPMALVQYDFSRGESFELSREFDLPFDAGEAERVQIELRADDSWHEFDVFVERAGKRFVTERPFSLANANPMTANVQWPSEEDRGTRIKTWLVLHPADSPQSEVIDTGRMRVTLAVRQLSPLGASFAKARYNYRRVADHVPLGRYVRVSLFLVAANVLLTVLSSSLVAYAFARLNWPGRDFCFVLMLATMMIPGQVTMIPNFLIWKELGAYNTLAPMWVGAAFGSAFFIFLLRQFLKGIPRDLEDAARIDGCGFLRIYWHVMLPLVKPSLAAIAIFTFMGAWNDFMGPLIFLADQRLYPLAFGLYALSVQVSNNPPITMAASVLMTLPVIVIFFLAQRYFIQGVTLTGMKG
jgi:ABC-type glycerol-3-phosphate transport system permease component